jgi:adenylate cyclase
LCGKTPTEPLPFRNSWRTVNRESTDVKGPRNGFITVDRRIRTTSLSHGQRRLAAIVFMDMVGFTALAQKDEHLAMELVAELRGIVRQHLARHNGREVKTMGDGFLVEFASSLEAVKCAFDIQSLLHEVNSKRPEERKLVMRIGIHLGDVIHSAEDVAGDAVNVASRIEALAPPGGVCVTEQVYESVVGKVDYTFETLGSPELKNVSRPIDIYRIVGLGKNNWGPPLRKSALPKDRVAVLPFVNISRDQADEYFADGMTEEVISSISRVKGLRVIARTSVMRLKGQGKPIAQIGKELNAGSILEGSVRKAGDKIRVSIQLVEATSEEPQWSEEYDRELKDVFAIQSDIAQKVAGALQVQVLGVTAQTLEKRQTDSLEAYVAYLRGRQLWNKRTQEGLTKAIEFFERSLKADGRYAKAYSGLADAYATLALLEFMAPSKAYPKAKEAVEKSLSLDGGLVEAHTSLGLIRFQYDWDWQGAEEEFRRAIALNQNYAPAHHFYADYLKAMGRFDEAMEEIGKAQELDPLSLAISAGAGHVLYLSRQYEKAIEQYGKAVELDPSFMQTHVWFGRPYLEKGMFSEALTELETGVKLSGESTLALAMFGHGLASAGRKEEALNILATLKERSKYQYVPSYWMAVVYNGFRDKDQVLKWLRKAYEERSSWLVWANVEPRFDWLKDDRDFRSLMDSMNFPPKVGSGHRLASASNP